MVCNNDFYVNREFEIIVKFNIVDENMACMYTIL